MQQAAAMLPGRHDFALFCERPAEQTSTLVVVEGAEIARAEGLLLIRLRASHFLWKMVRRVVGTLVEVGSGYLDEDDFTALLAGNPLPASEGTPAEWTAPPSGLFLERVLYPGDPPLGPLVPIIAVPEEPRLAPLQLPEREPSRPATSRGAPPRPRHDDRASGRRPSRPPRR
jgi:tRNA pseudouridine38-40 synthase